MAPQNGIPVVRDAIRHLMRIIVTTPFAPESPAIGRFTPTTAGRQAKHRDLAAQVVPESCMVLHDVALCEARRVRLEHPADGTRSERFTFKPGTRRERFAVNIQGSS
jgi:hypothetical protein